MADASDKAKRVGALLLLCAACLSSACYSAWDGKTADRIADAAVAALPGEAAAFLKGQSRYFRQGLAADSETVERYAGFGTFDTTGYSAGKLGGQIELLRCLFPSERSPYMAYRMGIVAKLLLELNSPFATAASPRDRSLRKEFMKDIATHRGELRHTERRPRLIRNPTAYIKRATERAAGWAGPVKSQYLRGKGYNAIARQAASRFYDEAVHSITDVFNTIASGGSGAASPAERYAFFSDACDFYLRRGMKGEALAAYRKAGKAASSLRPEEIKTLEEAIDYYELVLGVASLEKRMREGGIEIRDTASSRMKAALFPALSRIARDAVASGKNDEARVALALCLRENYLPERTLYDLKKLYRLDNLPNLDVPENAWKIYREANRLESMAGRDRAEGRLWAAGNDFIRAAALYAAIPGSVRDLKRASRIRLRQIAKKMKAIPAEPLFSEELFQSALDSMEEGDIDEAVRDLQLTRRWKKDDRTIGIAIGEAEALKLFQKGKELYRKGRYDRGVALFRKVVERYPRSSFVRSAKKMIDFYERRKALEAGKLMLLLKGAYEALFVGDRKGVYGLTDEILESMPEKDLRDRAQLLVAVAWYQSNQSGYQDIDKIFRDLLDNQVLEEDGGKLVLKKRIDFYFALSDPFPEMDLDEFDEAMLAKLDLGGPSVAIPAAEDAEDAIDDARDEINRVEDIIARAEDEGRDMKDARSLLDEAQKGLDTAVDSFDEGAYEEAKSEAERARDKAVEAREKAGGIIEVAEDVRQDAEQKIEDAESAISDAQSALDEAEDSHETEFDDQRDELDKARDLLEDARDMFDEGEYEMAMEKAEEAMDKAEDVEKEAEDLKGQASSEEEGSEE